MDGGVTHEETPGSLAARIEYLIKTVHPAGRGPYTLAEISDGVGISEGYLSQLQNGRRDNPTKLHLEAIARFFGVSAAYFFDDTEAKKTVEQLALLEALRDTGLKKVMMRSLDLDEAGRSFLAEMVHKLGAMQQSRNPAKQNQQPQPRNIDNAEDDSR